MEEITVPETLQGASRAPFEEDEDLPMVIWLRGDEEICGEFTMDAEAAMKMLGIKRSRLTQISGRELRVGKIRIDRYVRPVYRRADVENYLEWTRASVSHQKSSQAIELAAKKMDEQRSQLLETLTEFTQRFETETKERVAEDLQELQRLVLHKLQQIEQQLGRQKRHFDDRLAKGEAQQSERWSEFAASLNLLLQLRQEFDGLKEIVGLAMDQGRKNEGLIRQQELNQQQLLQSVKALTQELHSQKKDWLELGIYLQKEWKKTSERLNKALATTAPEPKPRRRIPAKLRQRLKTIF